MRWHVYEKGVDLCDYAKVDGEWTHRQYTTDVKIEWFSFHSDLSGREWLSPEILGRDKGTWLDDVPKRLYIGTPLFHCMIGARSQQVIPFTKRPDSPPGKHWRRTFWSPVTFHLPLWIVILRSNRRKRANQ